MLSLLKGMLITFGFVTTNAVAAPQDHCAPYAHDNTVIAVISELAKLMSYEYHELCELPRLMAIYPTRIQVYNSSKDSYQEHISITLHYSENSCEYQYNLVENNWGKKQCYNTW